MDSCENLVNSANANGITENKEDVNSVPNCQPIDSSLLDKTRDNSVDSVNETVYPSSGKIEPEKRKKLIVFLRDCLTDVKKMNLNDLDQELNLIAEKIDADLQKSSKNNDDEEEDGLTLTQVLAEINKPDSDIMKEDQPHHEDINIPSSLTDSAPVEASSSSAVIDKDAKCNGKNKENSDSSEDKLAFNHGSLPIKIKSEPVDDTDDFNNFIPSHAQATHEVPEKKVPTTRDSLETPKTTSKVKRIRGSTSKRSSSSTRRKILFDPESNKKLTDYFPIRQKISTPNIPKSKEMTDLSFILSAMDGDPTFCIVCKKSFKANSTLKTHLSELHGFSKKSLFQSRPIKKDKITEEHSMDESN